ncbi:MULTISPECIES: helix-turn-helix transcriptional regulator [Nocardia]|uniref:helix-turn-helix transcriptional regulator n=1 Tax=Nocardia TaxID=1817 RepID=UPI0013007A4A|nr:MULTISPECIES: helix-turn-helix domain-containing protein [Nocardia]
MSPTTWLNRREVSAITGFSVKTLEDWARMKPRKGPKCFKVSNRYRYLSEDVRVWMAEQQQMSAV